jgi:uncharacterized OB-fold protein
MPGKATEYYCNNCGTLVSPSDTCCPSCGKKLSEVERAIKKEIIEVVGISDRTSVLLSSSMDMLKIMF